MLLILDEKTEEHISSKSNDASIDIPTNNETIVAVKSDQNSTPELQTDNSVHNTDAAHESIEKSKSTTNCVQSNTHSETVTPNIDIGIESIPSSAQTPTQFPTDVAVPESDELPARNPTKEDLEEAGEEDVKEVKEVDDDDLYDPEVAIHVEEHKGTVVEPNKSNAASETTPNEKPKEISTTTEDVAATFSDDDIKIDDDLSSDSEEEDSESEDESSSDSESDRESVAGGEVDDADEDFEEEINGPILSKNEVVDEVAPTIAPDYKIPENAPLQLVGNISLVVEKSIIVKANVSGEFRILKESSVFCLKDRTVIGLLFETFGRIQSPVYRIQFNSDEELNKFKDKVGEEVYYVVPDSQFVYTESIKQIKGTDASNCHDEELPEEEQEFSDDEAEAAAKLSKKKRKNKNKPQDKSKRRRDFDQPNRDQPFTNNLYNPYGYNTPASVPRLPGSQQTPVNQCIVPNNSYDQWQNQPPQYNPAYQQAPLQNQAIPNQAPQHQNCNPQGQFHQNGIYNVPQTLPQLPYHSQYNQPYYPAQHQLQPPQIPQIPPQHYNNLGPNQGPNQGGMHGNNGYPNQGSNPMNGQFNYGSNQGNYYQR